MRACAVCPPRAVPAGAPSAVPLPASRQLSGLRPVTVALTAAEREDRHCAAETAAAAAAAAERERERERERKTKRESAHERERQRERQRKRHRDSC